MAQFNRVIGLFGAVMINLGAIIGAGIFVIIGMAIGKAGPSILISIILSGLIAMLTGISFSEIAQHVTKEGGVYEYARESLAPSAGFVGGWMWTFGNIIALAAVSLSMGSYINSLLGTAIPLVYYGTAAILIFMTVNLLGIKNSVKTLTGLVAFNVIVLVIFVIAGFTLFNKANLAVFLPNGTSGLIAGASIIFFAFTGFSRVTTIGDEVKNPERTIPLAIVISIIISTALYFMVAYTALGLVPYSKMADSAAPLSLAMSVLKSKVLDVVISIGGITATAGVILTGILGTSRVFFAMGRDKELPSALGSVSKSATPMNAIVVSSFIGILFIFLTSFSNIVEASNASVLIAYAIMNVSALYLSSKLYKAEAEPKHLREHRLFPMIPLAGLASIAIIILYLGYQALGITAAIMVIGAAYYMLKFAFANRLNIIGKSLKSPRHSLVRTVTK
ncbi:MAG: amino acid permease [Candidatus Marsarchaeota archaeon]|nr:amino acid permease [Candidatus Marsarchaeota archaeon]